MVVLALLDIIYDCKTIDVLLNISIGLFGSGCVSLIITVPSYNVSKQQTINKYLLETNRIAKEIQKIEFLFSEFSVDALIPYLYCLNNLDFEGNKTYKENFDEFQIVKEKLVMEYYDNHYNKKVKFNDIVRKYCDDCVYEISEDIVSKLKEAADNYVDVSYINTIELSLILDDIQFFWRNKKRRQLFEETYYKIESLLNKISRNADTFKRYINGDNNYAYIADKIFNLQKELYTMEVESTKESIKYTVNYTFVSEIFKNIEAMRNKKKRGTSTRNTAIFPFTITSYKQDSF